jgi:transcriptional regulator with XRE-family HTH domain
VTNGAAGLDSLSLDLGTAIRAARNRSGVSMRTLATRCGVSQPFLSEVERGMATPSIATLYRIADSLGLSPAQLLPTASGDDVQVIRAADGRRVASSEHAASAIGRLVLADDRRGLEIYEYTASADDDLDVWFQHAGTKVLYVIEGRLTVEFDHRPSVLVGEGDCLVHAGELAHRWHVETPPVHLFLVIVRIPGDAPRAG